MKKANIMKNYLISSLLLGALSLASGSASAESYELCAGETSVDLPDGSTVPMWGYALGGSTNGVCDGQITFPGPRLTVSDGTLTINLTNTLPESTSIVIPGLAIPAGGPTWDDDSVGSRNGNQTKKVRSFGAETDGTTPGTYSWTDVRPGTFIYHSGTHPQKQVYMGLYGAVTQDAVAADTVAGTPAEAYPGVEYFNEVVLFYSEIDPDLNASITELYAPTGTVEPYSTSIHYHPKWFLVNGAPYSTACTDSVGNGLDDASGYACADMVQTLDIAAGIAGTKTLVRFLSAAGETHVPVLQGMHMTIHAEDGLQYGWEDTSAGTSGTAPREQYSVMLPPLKTKDAIVRAPAAGSYAIYDGNGYMTNPTDILNTDVGDPVGGMLRFLAFGTANNLPPVADANGPYNGVTDTPVAFDANGSTDDGAIVSYDWDFGDGTVVLDAGATPSHTYVFDALATYPIAYDVTLTVTDDGGLFTSAATTATISANLVPSANAGGPYTGSVGTSVVFDGTGSTDDGAIVSYDWDFGDGAVGTGATPSHAYAADGTYAVTLTVTDDGGLSSISAATTADIAPNQLPVANAGLAQNGTSGSPVSFDGTGSSDADGTIVGYAWDFGDGNVGTGATPNHTYADAGTFTVTLIVTDNAGGESAPAQTTAEIGAVNLPPVADAGGPYSASIILDGGLVYFNGSGSDPDGTIASYDWDFGDGTVVLNAGATPSHQYAASSTYVVTLTVTDDGGATATDTAIVSIVNNQAPVAVNDTAAVPRGNGSMAFVDLTSNDTDFEDGNVDPNSIVITSDPARGSVNIVSGGVEYTNEGGGTGTYFLTYTVADSDGAVSNEATVTINIIR